MAICYRDREEPARQTKRADDGGIDRPSRQHLLCRVQVGDVEGGIVRHQHGISGERKELRQHGANGRGIGHHRVRDPRQPADEGRDRVGRLHEPRERVEEPSPGHAHRADLDDALRGGRTAGGLEIHHHEGGLAERTRERIVDPRPPAIGSRVEMKARVRAEQLLRPALVASHRTAAALVGADAGDAADLRARIASVFEGSDVHQPDTLMGVTSDDLLKAVQKAVASAR